MVFVSASKQVVSNNFINHANFPSESPDFGWKENLGRPRAIFLNSALETDEGDNLLNMYAKNRSIQHLFNIYQSFFVADFAFSKINDKL